MLLMERNRVFDPKTGIAPIIGWTGKKFKKNANFFEISVDFAASHRIKYYYRMRCGEKGYAFLTALRQLNR